MTWRARLARAVTWVRAGRGVPAVPWSAWAGRLERAVEAAHYQCLECGNARVTVEYRPGLGDWVPVSHHWAANGPGDSCPVLAGGLAAWQAHNDLWDALAATGLLVGSYGEAAWARRQLVIA